jgi:hypothetical protein
MTHAIDELISRSKLKYILRELNTANFYKKKKKKKKKEKKYDTAPLQKTVPGTMLSVTALFIGPSVHLIAI